MEPVSFPSTNANPPSQPNPWSKNWRGNGQGPVPPALPIQEQQLLLPSIQNPTSSVRPQLPVQPNPNPNNKAS